MRCESGENRFSVEKCNNFVVFWSLFKILNGFEKKFTHPINLYVIGNRCTKCCL